MSTSTQTSTNRFTLSFLFKLTNDGLPAPEAIMSEPGSIDVSIDMNGLLYGPYDTGIRTTFGTYTGRRHLQYTEEMKAVDLELHNFIKFVNQARAELSITSAPIDGSMLITTVRQLMNSAIN